MQKNTALWIIFPVSIALLDAQTLRATRAQPLRTHRQTHEGLLVLLQQLDDRRRRVLQVEAPHPVCVVR
jgi:hypothetical protein